MSEGRTGATGAAGAGTDPDDRAQAGGGRRRIVSSRHLASADLWQSSEFEFGLIIAHNAFGRWVTKCMGAAGHPGLSVLEVLVLHNVNHRDRQKRLSDVAFMLNVEEPHTVNYALRKLVRSGLIEGEKRGKEIFYAATGEGREACRRYRDVRERCLIDSLRTMDLDPERLSEVAALLRSMSGLYDQASRAATSL